ncbi:MAG TPA: redoxin domain-containing protein [Methylomirabilota bacterium]|nr:redoxin domain-containing protein [Methylomirabilota bacterium]
MIDSPSRRRFLTRTGAALLLAGVAPTRRPGAAWAAVQAKVGQPAPAFTAPSTAGTPVSLASYKGKIVVLEWTNHECPYVRKHYESGNMQALQREATGQGVIWLTLISSAKGEQGYVTAAQADELTVSRKAAPTAVLLDEPGTVGRMYGATNTPHMYVIDTAGTLVYAGAIDDRPTTRRADVQGASNYVRAALEALRAGQPVKTPITRAYGCTVKYS